MDTHLFFTSLGKAVSLATQSSSLRFSHNKKISWPVFVSEAPGNSCGDLSHCTGRLEVGFPLPLMILITVDDSINLLRNHILENEDVSIEKMLSNMTCPQQI